MFNLSDINLRYLILSDDTLNSIVNEKICDYLYSHDYTILPIKSFYKNQFFEAFIAISSYDDNSDLEFDAMFIRETFNLQSIIIKFKGQEQPKVLKNDGTENILIITNYDSQLEKKTYIYQGISFTLTEKKRYFFPKGKEDLRVGMIIEYFNNNKWYSKTVQDVDLEFDKMYKLLIKYEKIRVEC
jgi:hypothetical protein